MNADEALFTRKVEGLVAACYENERPLHGLAGLLDWRFDGAISDCIRAGAISGKAGECVYFPIQRAGALYHLILVGAGTTSAPGKREGLPAATVRALRKNLDTLKIAEFGLSRQDLGEEIPIDLPTSAWMLL